MSVNDFNDKGRAYVSEDEFFEYVERTAIDGDTKKVHIDNEGQEVVWYCNSFGCKLAEYNRTEGYGITF